MDGSQHRDLMRPGCGRGEDPTAPTPPGRQELHLREHSLLCFFISRDHIRWQLRESSSLCSEGLTDQHRLECTLAFENLQSPPLARLEELRCASKRPTPPRLPYLQERFFLGPDGAVNPDGTQSDLQDDGQRRL